MTANNEAMCPLAWWLISLDVQVYVRGNVVRNLMYPFRPLCVAEVIHACQPCLLQTSSISSASVAMMTSASKGEAATLQ
jgi:hypothetical protein